MMMRLKETHPTVIKLEKLFDYMAELGLTISVTRMGETLVWDNEWPNKDLMVKDADNGEPISTTFPPNLEYKVIYGD
jgi:hypothetical protein